MLITTGSATSDLDIAFFRENFMARAFQGIRTTLMTTTRAELWTTSLHRAMLSTHYITATLRLRVRLKKRSVELESILSRLSSSCV